MNEFEVLDTNDSPRKMESTWESLNWWEGKRLMYNLILVGCELFFMLYYWEGTVIYGVTEALIGSIFFTFLGNICYSVGWGSEIITTYYFNSAEGWKKMRKALFVLGALFSICLTTMVYINLFENPWPLD